MAKTIIGAYLPYENVRRNAYWTRVGIDTRLKVDEDNIEDYKKHLRDCDNNPTIGYLAQREYITGKPMNYPECAKRNRHYMERQPEIKALKESIKEKINKTLYPSTKHIRKYIIDNERVVLNRIKKVEKYTIFNKLKIMFKRFV